MKPVLVRLPIPYIQALDALVDAKMYPNRSELIRVAIRDLLTVEVWGKKKVE